MALSPLQEAEEERVEEVDATPGPSKTYRLNKTTNEIGGRIDGDEALRQFIEKTIRTARFRFLIYDEDYGSELDDLIGEDVTQELIETEIPAVITEALVYDDRIADVTDFVVMRQGDQLYVSFRVITTTGDELIEEVAI